jgi:signal transduction histidine kinase
VGKLYEFDVVPGEIRQVFQNILSNALKFSKKDVSPIINISSEIVEESLQTNTIFGSGRFCRFKISDNGIGFDPNYKDKIFTIFQRLNSKSQYEGTGIGLAIVKRIIDKHHGRITATGKENEGSEFIIELPVKQVNTLPALVPVVC